MFVFSAEKSGAICSVFTKGHDAHTKPHYTITFSSKKKHNVSDSEMSKVLALILKELETNLLERFHGSQPEVQLRPVITLIAPTGEVDDLVQLSVECEEVILQFLKQCRSFNCVAEIDYDPSYDIVFDFKTLDVSRVYNKKCNVDFDISWARHNKSLLEEAQQFDLKNAQAARSFLEEKDDIRTKQSRRVELSLSLGVGGYRPGMTVDAKNGNVKTYVDVAGHFGARSTAAVAPAPAPSGVSLANAVPALEADTAASTITTTQVKSTTDSPGGKYGNLRRRQTQKRK